MDDTIFYNLVKLITDVYGVKNVETTTTINSFNRISEDNDEFFERFQIEFNVDMTGFNYYDFFNEDQFYILALWHLILWLTGKKKKKKILTVGHLVEVAKVGKWFDVE